MSVQKAARRSKLTDTELLQIGAEHGRPSVAYLPVWRAIEGDLLEKLCARESEALIIERMARAMAKASSWDGWDTAKTPAQTPNGNDPEEERDYWRDMARAALASVPAVDEQEDFEQWCQINEYDCTHRLDGTGYNNDATRRASRAWHERASRAALTSAPATDVRTVLADLLDIVDSNTCVHESTHRGGAIWTICDGCGMKWADDEGGFVPHQDAPAVVAARAALRIAPQVGGNVAIRRALEGMRRWFGNWPELVPANDKMADAIQAVAAMNAISKHDDAVNLASARDVGPRLQWSANVLYHAIKEVLLNHRLSNRQTDDGDFFPLVDHLCNEGANTTESGEFEVALMCDAIYNDVLTKLAPVGLQVMGYSSGIHFRPRQVEQSIILTRDPQPEHGFVHAVYAVSPTAAPEVSAIAGVHRTDDAAPANDASKEQR